MSRVAGRSFSMSMDGHVARSGQNLDTLPGLVDNSTVAEVASSPAVAHFQLTRR